MNCLVILVSLPKTNPEQQAAAAAGTDVLLAEPDLELAICLLALQPGVRLHTGHRARLP